MEEKVITNEEKHDTYARLHERLKKALANGFWLEATMIEYAIIEDRTAAILYHAGISENSWDKKLANKLNAIEHQIGKKHPIISKKVSPALIQEIRGWKDLRNEAVHRACRTIYSEEALQAVAEHGKELVRRISNDSQKVKRAAEKGRKI